LLEKGRLTGDREEAFLNLVESFSRGDVPTGPDDNTQYSWAQVAQDARNLAQEYRNASDSAARLHVLRSWLNSQEGYLLKPMNCPHHIQIYKSQPRSYRDLPVRLAEFGTVYRFEQSGELGGMTRVRGFTQDDAHLFVTPEQVEDELEHNIDLVLMILQTLGLSDYRVRVSVRDPNSRKYVGAPALWENAEQTLVRVVSRRQMNY
ncbi:MAG: aminoacyl--tRNA ligase-related protein, partial [Phycisphaerales bacterium]|nr:aminoacyl--tRNA ligase-related protein [Phycisphaerales bacterium]